MKDMIKKITPYFLINWYHFILALFGAVFYSFPSKYLKVVGVTGTNGKSTTIEMIAKIFEEASYSGRYDARYIEHPARYKTASLSSISFRIGEKEQPNLLKMTMPGRFQIQKFLREAVNQKCQCAALEVTSEGIKQSRHKFIDFDTAVFTNLSPEHIESHGGFENYKKAKSELFKATKNIHIINLDDENANDFLQFPAEKKWGYTMNREQKTESNKNLFIVYCSLFAPGSSGISFEVQNTKFNLKLLGEFNIYNALAAICVGLSQGISLEICKSALEKIKGIPGRMEEVISEPFKVFVDYAFTPNALGKVYQTLTKNYKLPTNKLICILGSCGGGRDKWKRPILGAIAAKYCDEVIITNEDPYNENPMDIIEQVAKGAENISINQFTPLDKLSNGASPHKSAVYKILDRREAIKESLKLAKAKDVIVITGKGCEPWICVAKGKKIPWDDRRVVIEEAEKLKIPLAP